MWFFFRILKLFFITGFLLQYLGNWYKTNGPLVNFTIFNTSNKNKAGDINSPWNLLVFFLFAKQNGNAFTESFWNSRFQSQTTYTVVIYRFSLQRSIRIPYICGLDRYRVKNNSQLKEKTPVSVIFVGWKKKQQQQQQKTKMYVVNVLKFCTLKFPTKWYVQTVQTQIRLLLKEQSDQGLCCLPFH